MQVAAAVASGGGVVGETNAWAQVVVQLGDIRGGRDAERPAFFQFIQDVRNYLQQIRDALAAPVEAVREAAPRAAGGALAGAARGGPLGAVVAGVGAVFGR
jgi:hypothetical protein